MKRLISDIPHEQILLSLYQNNLIQQKSIGQFINTTLRPQYNAQGPTFWAQKDKEIQGENAYEAMQFQSEMEVFPINRLRTLSNNRWEDPYFAAAINKKAGQDFFDEKEEEYLKNGLESCNLSRPAQSMNFEYLNNQEQGGNINKEIPKKEQLYEEDRLMSQYSSLHTIIEEQNDIDQTNNSFYAQEWMQYQYDQPNFVQEEDQTHTKTSTLNLNQDESEKLPLMIKLKGKKAKSTNSLKLKKRNSISHSSSVYKKNKQMEDVAGNGEGEDKKNNLARMSSNLIKKKSQEENSENTPSNINKGMVGPLTLTERMERVLKYLNKKRMKSQMKKFCYKCRKQVAEKRLRIKGRFVTKQQAFDILGMTSQDLKNNEIIQKLLETHANSDFLYSKLQLNSLVESDGKKSIKIRNFQALIDDSYNHNTTKSSLLPFGTPSLYSSLSSSKPLSALEDELIQQISLNLRISTSKTEGGIDPFHNNHVSKVLISNFPAQGYTQSALSVEENLKRSLSNLRIEGYIQPLFRIEKDFPIRSSGNI